jgi:hypothetical protein
MKKLQIPNSVTRSINKVGFKLKKNSPEILIVAGVIGTVASAVMACKATLKVNEVVDEAKENIDRIHEAKETGYTEAGETYDAEDSKKDLALVYAQTGLKFVKLYGPSVALGALSLTGIISSHHILRKRNISLIAAYAAVDKGFKDYRGRVIERFGKELDKELRHNIKTKEVEEIVVNEDGTEQVIKTKVNVVNPNDISEYARFYDDGCTGWDKNPEYSLMYLKNVQNWANNRLQAEGRLFLNEVYEALGIPKTKAGQSVGWVYDEANPDSDNYVDFGITDIHNEKVRDFVNGYERVVLLDFNVNGDIQILMK